MSDNWQVVLIKEPRMNDFRDDFFPRKCHYKRDAEELVREIERKGGEAKVIRSPQRA